MNRAKKKTIISLCAVFALAVAIESNGYDIFDRPDGANWACDIDPQCHRLSAEDTQLVQRFLGHKIDTSRIRIFNRDFLGLLGRPMAPNGHIYLDESWYDPADKEKQMKRKTFLLHEAIHVWQDQQGRNLWLEAIGEWFRNGFNYNSSYRYSLNINQRFEFLGLEQQGKIVEDYARLRMELDELTRSATNQISLKCNEILPIVKIISSTFPAVVPAICNDQTPQFTPRETLRFGS